MWLMTLAVSAVFIPNWFWIINTTHVDIYLLDNIDDIERTQNHILPYQSQMYRNHTCTVLAVLLLFSYVFLPVFQ